MPRELRPDAEGAVHHVFARGNNRQLIYRDRADRLIYLRILGAVVARMRWRCLAYCLMDNHVHLLLETVDANLAAGMQRLHGRYAQVFNQRHGRSGHVFQGRYGSALIERDEQLLSVLRYIARNPVEARLCNEPEQWPWGSARAVLTGDPPAWLHVGRLFEYLQALGGDPTRRYAALIAMACADEGKLTGSMVDTRSIVRGKAARTDPRQSASGPRRRTV